MGERIVYESSDWRYFGEARLWEKFESGTWEPCAWDPETGREWIETDDGDLLMLIPISRHALPGWADVTHYPDGARIHDASRGILAD